MSNEATSLVTTETLRARKAARHATAHGGMLAAAMLHTSAPAGLYGDLYARAVHVARLGRFALELKPKGAGR